MSRKLSVKDIDDLMKSVDSIVKDNIDKIPIQIVDELVTLGKAKAEELNAAAPHSNTEIPKVYSKITENSLKGYIVLQGESAVYDEFGTGEKGADDAHPLKNNFGLNPYNSGPFVSKHISETTGRHYWFYPKMAGVEPYYDFIKEEGRKPTGFTEGIPSGKQMYNTSVYLQQIKQGVIKKTLDEWLAKPKSISDTSLKE